MRKKLDNNAGFTIIELMIATAVLSVVLVIVAMVMTNIGRLYFKGANQAKMQNNVRSITADIAQRMQLSGGQRAPAADNGTVKAYCIGTARYTYVLGVQLGKEGSPYKHVLWRDKVAPGTCTNNVQLNEEQPTGSVDGVELITTKSRLTHFDIAFGDPSSISIGLAYGDDDLFIPATLGTPNPKCAGNVGDQFCATASLRTSLMQRVTEAD